MEVEATRPEINFRKGDLVRCAGTTLNLGKVIGFTSVMNQLRVYVRWQDGVATREEPHALVMDTPRPRETEEDHELHDLQRRCQEAEAEAHSKDQAMALMVDQKKRLEVQVGRNAAALRECEQELARTKGENSDLVRYNQELELQMEELELQMDALEETVDRQQKELTRVEGKYAVETAKNYRPCRLTHEQFNALQDAVEKSGPWGLARDLLVGEGE